MQTPTVLGVVADYFRNLRQNRPLKPPPQKGGSEWVCIVEGYLLQMRQTRSRGIIWRPRYCYVEELQSWDSEDSPRSVGQML